MLPFILAGVAALVGTGGKKAYDGISLKREADQIEHSAAMRLGAAQLRLDRAAKTTIRAIDGLHRRQAMFRTKIQEDLARTIARVANVADGGWKALEAAAVDNDRLACACSVDVAVAPSLVQDTLIGVAAGLALRQSAMAAAGSFGLASTGVAISELSGAVATNASLAWLGGGAISAGGWGMAGGALALNAIGIGPAALFAGFAIAKHGERRLTGAIAYSAGVEEAVAREKLMRLNLKAVRMRAMEIETWGRRVSDRAAVLSRSINRGLDGLAAQVLRELDRELQDMLLVLAGLTGLLNALATLRVVGEAGELIKPGSNDPVGRARVLGGGYDDGRG